MYLSGGEGSKEADSDMWNEALFLIIGYNTGPWIQDFLEDSELVRFALSYRFAVDCPCAELYALYVVTVSTKSSHQLQRSLSKRENCCEVNLVQVSVRWTFSTGCASIDLR